MKNIIDNYISKEMDRKEFLKQIGLMLLAVFGVSSVLKYLAEQSTTPKATSSSLGYGNSSYGGVEEKHTANRALSRG